MSTARVTPEELRRRLGAERAGLPFLIYRTPDGTQQLFTLRDERERVTIGRGDGSDLCLELDPEVSRLHAELVRLGDDWVLADDGLSRNGSFVNGERVLARRRLNDGDVLQFGGSLVSFHNPRRPQRETTRPAPDGHEIALTETQRRVLVALCRPFRGGTQYALPATNRVIAEELFLSVDAVKDHLRVLFEKLGIEDLPDNQKRTRLVQRVLERGLVSTRELE
jgi:pSer/pThr/pTyr-binding forkhead associated (FHA) protein